MTADLTSAVPLAPGRWRLDPQHSSVLFKIRHLGLTNVRGRFNQFIVDLEIGTELSTTTLAASIELASIDTNQADRDAHLLSTEIFSADAHPVLTYRSDRITRLDDSRYRVDGTLTIREVSRPIPLDVEFTGTETMPGTDIARAGFVATSQLDRDDFGVDFNVPLGVDRFAIGKRVSIELDCQFLAPEQAG